MNAILKTLKDKWWQIALVAIGLDVLIALAALSFVFFVGDDPNKLSVWEWLQAVGYVITVAIAIRAIYVANRRAMAMEDSAKAGHETARAGHETAKAGHENARVGHDANEQKTYNDAVANLGNEKPSVRLGGIYGLFDLAQSKRQRSRNITEILCAHLRETTQRKDYQKDNSQQPSNEIQSLLNVLCELNERNLAHEETSNIKLNLTQSYLRWAILENKNLRGAQLQGANLQRATMIDAGLQGADLSEAGLQGANLWEAKLQGADLSQAELQGADLSQAELQGADLWEAKLQGADLSQAELQGADLWEAKLQGAGLQGADLSEAGLQGADLSWAELQGADLSQAGLQGAELRGAGLQGADLRGAELQGATTANKWDASLGKPFVEWMKKRIDRDTDLENVVFSGGLTDEKIAEIQNVLEQLVQDGLYVKSKADALCAELRENHLGEASHKPPGNVITGVLKEEMANKIIEDYRKGLKIP